MRTIPALLLLLLLCACNAPRVVYDYDDRAEFNNYRSYAIYPDFVSGLSPLDEDRLLESLEAGMREKGFPTSTNPDLFVNVYTEEYREESRNTMGVGIGGGSGGIGMGVSGGIPLGGDRTYLNLTFDFIDAEADELVWQAVVTAKFDKDASPEKRMAYFDKIVGKALEGYPPER